MDPNLGNIGNNLNGITDGSSALKVDPVPSTTPNDNIIDFPKEKISTNDNINKNSTPGEIIDFPGKNNDNNTQNNNESNNENLDNKEPSNNEQNDNKEEKIGEGKKVNEKGEVEDTSTKKSVKAVGRVAAAYFTGGQSVGADKKIADNKYADKAIGVVSDTLDKVPGVETVSKELDESGLADGVNDVLDTAASIKNKDIKGTIDSAKKAAKSTKKVKKHVRKKMLKIILPIVVPIVLTIFVTAVVVTAILGPVLGGFLDVVENEDTTMEKWEDSIEDPGMYEGIYTDSYDKGVLVDGETVKYTVPYYYQGNYHEPFGGGTIATSGCSVTSLAMVISYFRNITTPPDVVNMIKNKKGNYNYYYSGDVGQSWAIMTEVPTFYGLSSSQISFSSIPSALQSGKLVIGSFGCCTFTKKGHFIVITGYDKDTNSFYVNDPNHKNFTGKPFSAATISGESKAFWAIG